MVVPYSRKKTTLPGISVFHPYSAYALFLFQSSLLEHPEQFLLIRVLFFIVRISHLIITSKIRPTQLITFATTPFRCITLKTYWMQKKKKQTQISKKQTNKKKTKNTYKTKNIIILRKKKKATHIMNCHVSEFDPQIFAF